MGWLHLMQPVACADLLQKMCGMAYITRTSESVFGLPIVPFLFQVKFANPLIIPGVV
jgi:hypothetical protein